nr:MAG TPA: hypothetical protein [Caudoviricetes sp.]
MILWILLFFECASIEIYVVMLTQNAFEKVLPDWEEDAQEISIILLISATIFEWLFAPYFAWMMWKWVKKKRKEGDKEE